MGNEMRTPNNRCELEVTYYLLTPTYGTIRTTTKSSNSWKYGNGDTITIIIIGFITIYGSENEIEQRTAPIS
jgi:hypothetical protein